MVAVWFSRRLENHRHLNFLRKEQNQTSNPDCYRRNLKKTSITTNYRLTLISRELREIAT